LEGMRMLVTAGATVEPIDPVRHLSNRSSGKMGYAIARAAARRGAEVVLVSGPSNLEPPLDVSVINVKTTEDMKQAVFDYRESCDVIIKAAAVSDYRPAATAEQKIKKEKGIETIELVQTTDILAELGRSKAEGDYLLVGFAAETDDLIRHAKEKLKQKNLDLIVANDVSRTDAGFETDTNQVKLIHRDGRIEDLPLMTKNDVAQHLIDRVKELWKKAS
ncbi:bifunctional phosphopantothenoylcysteine decarboxylase/phosphopantothenate--cysteine ligase CoaBC, partial [Thermodesulfobacteriota bacterium]